MMTMSTTISLMSTVTKHPLMMMILLILQSMSIAILTGSLTNLFWFSYILMISMISGTFILFMYMTSVASNEKINLSITMTMIMTMVLLISGMTYHPEDQLSSSKSWILDDTPMMTSLETMPLQKLFYPYSFMVTVMVVITLFFSMMCLSYIVNTDEGPLKMKN